MWVWFGRKFWKRSEAIEKSIHKFKMEFVYLCVEEKKKKKQIWNDCNHFNVYKKCKSPIQVAELPLLQHSFFFTLETILKMGKKTNKGDVEIICAKVTKHIRKGGGSWSWSESTMNNWLWIVLILYLYPRTTYTI